MIPIKKAIPSAIRPLVSQLKNTPLITQILGKLSLLGSQAGQDFWVYGEAFNQMRNGYFLDIGAHDGINLSNTYALESKYQWTGLCVEANPNTFKKLTANRKSKCVNACVDKIEGLVDFALRDGRGGIADDNLDNPSSAKDHYTIVKLKTISLKTLLDTHKAPSIIDYLSIDVEGAEERILSDFDFDAYLFRTITIERPSQKLKSILSDNGYRLIKEIPNLDCFYIHKSFRKEYKKNLFAFYAHKKISIVDK